MSNITSGAAELGPRYPGDYKDICSTLFRDNRDFDEANDEGGTSHSESAIFFRSLSSISNVCAIVGRCSASSAQQCFRIEKILSGQSSGLSGRKVPADTPRITRLELMVG